MAGLPGASVLTASNVSPPGILVSLSTMPTPAGGPIGLSAAASIRAAIASCFDLANEIPPPLLPLPPPPPLAPPGPKPMPELWAFMRESIHSLPSSLLSALNVAVLALSEEFRIRLSEKRPGLSLRGIKRQSLCKSNCSSSPTTSPLCVRRTRNTEPCRRQTQTILYGSSNRPWSSFFRRSSPSQRISPLAAEPPPPLSAPPLLMSSSSSAGPF
mmetsp:Transcript_21711/g.31825  ORF Transcript_21711/g.31825 Transcript_21711/m.31825 type:complete len:214 (-) Transcript_21711:130-771(-)